MIKLLGRVARRLGNFLLKITLPIGRGLLVIMGPILFIAVCMFPVLNLIFIGSMVDEFNRPKESRHVFDDMEDDDEFAGQIALAMLIASATYFSFFSWALSS